MLNFHCDYVFVVDPVLMSRVRIMAFFVILHDLAVVQLWAKPFDSGQKVFFHCLAGLDVSTASTKTQPVMT